MNKLSKFSAWTRNGEFSLPKSAQGVLGMTTHLSAGGPCGSACGAGGGDKKRTPVTCGSGCGADDAR